MTAPRPRRDRPTRIATARLAAILLVVGVASLTWASGPVKAQDLDDLAMLLLVDTSGSMAEEDGLGRVRIDGARTAVMTFLRSIPDGVPVGLRSYPDANVSNAPDGCSPGNLRYGVGPLDVVDASAEVRSLVADGQTPTSAAMRAAADDLRRAGLDRGTIVLVSDGESNCGAPPCDVAEELVAEGFQLTINTIGFQISERGRNELSCIAETTGGRYVDVDDAEELAEELAGLSAVRLELQVSAPTEVGSAVGSEADGTIAITATVRNVDGTAARDVQATLIFDADRSPGTLRPRRRLGNVAPGGSATATWSFRPPLELEERVLRYRVVVTVANGSEQERSGRLTLRPGVALEDMGPLLRDAQRIAILGDSFSSGEGAGGYEPSTTTAANGCHRTRRTYAVAIFPETDIFACSGAVTRDILYRNSQHDGEPAQVDQLQRGGTYDAVLMTIGGNDIGFAQLIKACVILIQCQDRRDHVEYVNCRGFAIVRCDEIRDVSHREAFYQRLGGLHPELRRAYRAVEDVLNAPEAIEARGGTAPLIVLGYPGLMPLNAPARGRCSSAFSPDEMAFAQEVGRATNATIASVVQELREEGRAVHFVADVEDAFQPDRTYCDPDPYVNRLERVAAGYGYVVGSNVDRPVLELFIPFPDDPALRDIQELMHPNENGYAAMTAALARWSTSESARAELDRPDIPESDYWRVRRNLEDLISVPELPRSLQVDESRALITDGLRPGSMAELRLRSDPRLLARARVDGQGRATLAFQIPSDARIGAHDLELGGVLEDGQVVALRAPIDITRSRPWPVLALGITALGLLVLALGGGVLVRRR